MRLRGRLCDITVRRVITIPVCLSQEDAVVCKVGRHRHGFAARSAGDDYSSRCSCQHRAADSMQISNFAATTT
eukprot:4165184-Amphidinium_carterae.2